MKKVQEELTLKVVELLEMKLPAKVLDLGCGFGFSTNLLREVGFEVIGIDINPLMIEKAKVKGLNVVLGDFRELEKYFNEKTFDYVVSISALQWVKNWNDMKRVAEGVYYVLKDNGKVGIQFYPFSEVELNMFCKAFRKVGFNCKATIESFSSKKRVIFLLIRKRH
jgi:ubiquinone/menaquinone biosynthesis C-methylase UbiE